MIMRNFSQYSPNFDQKKRKKKDIKFVIFHYTGMKSEQKAIHKLCSEKSKVSSHFFIKTNGKLLNLIPERYTAWHAGLSCWKKKVSLNEKSIGIEIQNPGHSYNYPKFTKKQVMSIIQLSKYLKKEFGILNKNFLGHSDISPLRKKDPGEKFPWQYLSKFKIGIWTNKNVVKKAKSEINKITKKNEQLFLKLLYNIGYCKIKKNSKNYKKIIIAFQRRFRPENVNGKIDNQCLDIAKNLIKQGLN
tara:strand:- start:180 stop:914 length:735 start_codon:yes stop_codon:yes gene_type:complete